MNASHVRSLRRQTIPHAERTSDRLPVKHDRHGARRQGPRSRHRDFQVGHGTSGEQPPAGDGHPACPLRRSIDARAVGGDAGVRVHLPVDFRDEDEREPRLDRLRPIRWSASRCCRTSRSDPTRSACGCGSDRRSSPGVPCRSWGAAPAGSASDESTGMPFTCGGSAPSDFSHAAKSSVPGNGVSITNCAKVRLARSATESVASKVAVAIARQTEDERAEHVHAVLAERSQPVDERLAALVEAFVDVLEPFGRDGFHAHQRALDVRTTHGVEELGILGGLHRDLSEEHGIRWQPLPGRPSARIARHEWPGVVRDDSDRCGAQPSGDPRA